MGLAGPIITYCEAASTTHMLKLEDEQVLCVMSENTAVLIGWKFTRVEQRRSGLAKSAAVSSSQHYKNDL